LACGWMLTKLMTATCDDILFLDVAIFALIAQIVFA